MDKQTRINLFYILVAVAGVMILQSIFAPRAERVQIPYSEFRQLVTDGKVTEAVITEHHIEGVLRTPLQSGATRFITRRVDPDLAADLVTQGVKVTGATEDTFLHRILSWTLPMMLFLGLWFFLVRRMGQGGLGGSYMALGKSKAKVYMEKDTKVTFKDVAGVDEAKEELEEIVAFLKDPKRYGRLGAHVPKGVLLVGPPGTGKTLLARAVAGEAGVPFFSINGSEFVEMFVGLGAARVRDLFEQGRQKVPCIIFIDELDALGRARGAGPMSGGHDEKEQTLNQLLSEMDGFDPSEGLVLLAATNRPEILDPALLRAGRFDRQVLVDRPDKIGREAILRVHLKKALLNTDVNPEQLAALTPGFTGADLANLVNEAALLATRRDAKDVTMDDFTRAIERIVAGLEKKTRILNELERRTVAWHESGHALVALALPGSGKVHKVSIIPRGIGALGYTIQRPTEDRYLMTQAELENKMAVLLGGRAAEHVVFGRLSTGAADDLAKATDIARSMVTQYGMVEKLGHVVLDKRPTTFLGGDGGFPWQPHTYSEETAREIDCAVREIVQTAFDRATAILTRNRAILDRTAEALLEAETLDEDTLGTLAKGLQQDAAA